MTGEFWKGQSNRASSVLDGMARGRGRELGRAWQNGVCVVWVEVRGMGSWLGWDRRTVRVLGWKGSGGGKEQCMGRGREGRVVTCGEESQEGNRR